ncbi:MAG: InlB B-repeat-containing protein [Lachnospiraceae bacterium]|nr:InlB B-repeat-containing protein [Lachnospiraceae bacterium]
MKKMSKKLLGIALTITVLVGQAMPALAAPGTAATGNVLDYAVETVVVPTTLKIALNPNQYQIATRFTLTADEAVDESKTYYTEADGVYSVVDEPEDSAIGTYYEVTTNNSQIVSLNYGIVNKSTEAKTVSVEIAADYAAAEPENPIVFVDELAKAQAYAESTNADGAKKGEYKMFLALASASALPTIPSTYEVTTDNAYDDSKTYYTVEDDVYSEAEINAEVGFAEGTTYYEKVTTITKNVVAATLGDILMETAAAGTWKTFAADETVKAKADIAYKLTEARFAIKDGEIVDFNTTQSQLGQKIEITALGGVAGFTITGAINPNADWTDADASAITFTPTYTWGDVTDEEVAVEGAYNQVNVTSSYTVTFNTNGGSEIQSASVESGETVSRPENDPTKEADEDNTYEFAGWYADEEFETEFDFDTPITENTTVYAKWTATAIITEPTASAESVSVGGSVNILLPEGVTITGIDKKKTDGTFNALPETYYTLEDIEGGKKLTLDDDVLTTYASATIIKVNFSEGDPISLNVTSN